MYNHTLHRTRKYFCRYFLQSLHTAEFLRTFAYLREDAVYNFINGKIKESKYCKDAMKKHFNKELVMTKKVMKIWRTLLNVRFLLMIMRMVMLK